MKKIISVVGARPNFMKVAPIHFEFQKYKSQINRDHGWNVLGQEGFEPVRMVAIDEDWSAVRFRRAAFIKTMTRAKQHRLSERGKGRSK